MHQDMESDGERNTLSSCIDKNTCKRYYTHWSRESVVDITRKTAIGSTATRSALTKWCAAAI
jgi:hypothetical protein